MEIKNNMLLEILWEQSYKVFREQLISKCSGTNSKILVMEKEHRTISHVLQLI